MTRGNEPPASAGDVDDTRVHLDLFIVGRAVDGIIVLAVEPVVPDLG
jgi:hypothetical protein